MGVFWKKKTNTNSQWTVKKCLFALVLLGLFSVVQFLNHTGFCYSAGRYLTKRELVDGYLFGQESSALSESQKLILAKSRGYPTGVQEINYPDCCSIKQGSFLITKFDHFINRSLFGKFLWEVTAYFPMEDSDSERRYYRQYMAHVNACGVVRSGDAKSIDVEYSDYIQALGKNKLFWSEAK